MARKIGTLLVILLLAFLVLLLLRQVQQATSRPALEALSSPPGFTGWVLGVDAERGEIKVESQTDKIVRPVTAMLTKDIPIFRREKGVLRQVDISNVHLQDQAELWLIGPVPNSFAAQVNVRQVVVEKLY